MDNSLMMRRSDTRTYRRNNLERLLRRQGLFTRQHVMERLALDILHYEERDIPIENAVIRNTDNVMVANRSGGESLLTEPRDQLRVVTDQIGKNDLDSVKSLKKCVTGFINHTHAALP